MDLASTYPNVPTIAIVNPSNGPGVSANSTYLAAISRLDGSDITVSGYIYTSYAARPINDIKADIDAWVSYYPKISSIFVDEVSSDVLDLPYYEEIKDYVKSKGIVNIVGNLGVLTPESFYSVFDIIVGKEGDAVGYTSDDYKHDFAGGRIERPRGQKALLLYNYPTYDYLEVREYSKYAGWLYFNDLSTWSNLTSHLEKMYNDFSINSTIENKHLDSDIAIGSLSLLDTTDKVSVVNAINEVKGEIVAVVGGDYLHDTDIGVTIQSYDADTVVDSLYIHTDNNYTTIEKNKLGNISITQPVDLDTIESNVSTNNNKITYPSVDSTKVGYISVTQAVDLDTMKSDISTHTTNSEIHANITRGTTAPTGGVDGDIYLQHG
jgi:hypothetical protein